MVVVVVVVEPVFPRVVVVRVPLEVRDLISGPDAGGVELSVVAGAAAVAVADVGLVEGGIIYVAGMPVQVDVPLALPRGDESLQRSGEVKLLVWPDSSSKPPVQKNSA